MQSQNSIFDDFAKVATGAAGTLAGAAREFETQTREKMREWLGGLDMVSRDEFEAVRALAIAHRAAPTAAAAVAAYPAIAIPWVANKPARTEIILCVPRGRSARQRQG